MKKSIAIILIPLALASCGPTKVDKTNTLEKFRLNGYDFILDQKEKYQTIQFKIPSCFLRNHYGAGMTNNPLERFTNTYNGYFSVERFHTHDRTYRFVADEIMTSDELNLFHDAYVKARLNTVQSGVSSLKKSTPKKVKFPGLIQVVHSMGDEYSNDELYYVIATLKVKNDFYIFQWAVRKEMLGYTYDDIEDILATVRLRK